AGDGGAGRADPALSAAGTDPGLPAAWPYGNTRHMTNPGIASSSSLAVRSRPGVGLRLVVWIVLVIVLLALPHLFSSRLALSTMSLMGTMIIFALSYNMLLGQTGMLSFGQAVFFGLGGFV